MFGGQGEREGPTPSGGGEGLSDIAQADCCQYFISPRFLIQSWLEIHGLDTGLGEVMVPFVTSQRSEWEFFFFQPTLHWTMTCELTGITVKCVV